MATATGDTPAIPADRGRRLAEVILASSRRAGLGPGSRLPTERQLAADLGATRTTVRRALAVLEAEGHISREVGPGYLPARRTLGPGQCGWRRRPGAHGRPAPGAAARRRRARAAPPSSRPPTSWRSGGCSSRPRWGWWWPGRRPPTSARWTAAWPAGSRRTAMTSSSCGTSPCTAASWPPATARCSPGCMPSSSEARHGQFWGDLKRRSASRERQRLYQADHRELVAALRARDADRAVEAMRTHLARVSSHLFDETG